MTKRIDPREIDGLTTSALGDFDTSTPPTTGDVPVWDGSLGKYVPGTPTSPPATATTHLVPLTTTVGGVPELVWDENDNLVMTEVPA